MIEDVYDCQREGFRSFSCMNEGTCQVSWNRRKRGEILNTWESEWKNWFFSDHLGNSKREWWRGPTDGSKRSKGQVSSSFFDCIEDWFLVFLDMIILWFYYEKKAYRRTIKNRLGALSCLLYSSFTSFSPFSRDLFFLFFFIHPPWNSWIGLDPRFSSRIDYSYSFQSQSYPKSWSTWTRLDLFHWCLLALVGKEKSSISFPHIKG